MSPTPLRQIAPLTATETTALLVEAVRKGFLVAGFEPVPGESVQGTLARATVEARRTLFPTHLLQRIPGDLAYLIAAHTVPLGFLVRLDPNNPDALLSAAIQYERAADVLPPEGFDAKLVARLAQIVRDLYAEQQAAMDEVDALTRQGRGGPRDQA